jgi:hypothetical protein
MNRGDNRIQNRKHLLTLIKFNANGSVSCRESEITNLTTNALLVTGQRETGVFGDKETRALILSFSGPATVHGFELVADINPLGRACRVGMIHVWEDGSQPLGETVVPSVDITGGEEVTETCST